MRKYLLFVGLFAIYSSAFADDWADSNSKVVDDFAIPAYETLHENSDKLVDANQSFCEKLDEASFENVKFNFHTTMDAWQSIQILRSGPAGQNMRSFRLVMWPDRSNAAAKHLRKLQKEAKAENLELDTFAKSSTAVQGLSAMERVIYAKGVKVDDFQTEGKANFKCQLIQAMGLNVQAISGELLSAWQGSYRDVISKPGKENDFYETDKDVASQLLNDLNTQLQVIIDQKINRPMTDKRFRLNRAESWRSQRSLRNISLNLLSAKEFYEIGFVPHVKDEALLKKQQKLFDTAIDLGKDLEIPLQIAHDDQADDLKKWIASIKALKSSINMELPKAIGITLGFNSLDGD